MCVYFVRGIEQSFFRERCARKRTKLEHAKHSTVSMRILHSNRIVFTWGKSLANETATTIPSKKKFFDTNAFVLSIADGVEEASPPLISIKLLVPPSNIACENDDEWRKEVGRACTICRRSDSTLDVDVVIGPIRLVLPRRAVVVMTCKLPYHQWELPPSKCSNRPSPS